MGAREGEETRSNLRVRVLLHKVHRPTRDCAIMKLIEGSLERCQIKGRNDSRSITGELRLARRQNRLS